MALTFTAITSGTCSTDLPWPDEPHLALWHAATILREHRGDGHLMALRVAGLDGAEALVSIGAAHGIKGQVRIATYTQDPQAIGSYGPLTTDREGLVVILQKVRLPA